MTETTDTPTSSVGGGGGSSQTGGEANFSDPKSGNAAQDATVSTGGSSVPENATLISRTTQQVQTQQVKTVTKIYTTREIHHLGPDGEPLEAFDANASTTAAPATTNNDYTNFPGPKGPYPRAPAHDVPSNSLADEQQNGANFSGAKPSYDAQFHDPHYSNTNFGANLLNAGGGPSALGESSSPACSSTAGSALSTTAPVASSFAPSSAGPTVSMTQTSAAQRIYDSFARNSQIGYQDYSNFPNYQDLTSSAGQMDATQTAPSGASPQPPIRRHILAAELGSDANYVQYSYPGQTLPLPGGPLSSMHSPSSAIYGNFADDSSGVGVPQGYLDRRQTFAEDVHSGYGHFGGAPSAGAGPPGSGTMYEDAESAYQHLQALQQAAAMEQQQQSGLYFSAGGLLSQGVTPGSSTIQAVPPSRAIINAVNAAGAPAAPVTAVGPDGVRWRDPDLHEVIEFLSHPNHIVRANAAAYLQHLCFMDDSMKAKTRALGGIAPLVALLAQDVPEVQRNSCGALRNLSYGRQNDENKRAIRAASGIGALVRLLRKTPDNEIRELVTSVLWNLSSCEELKRAIIDEALGTLVSTVIIPHSGWDRAREQSSNAIPEIYWSTVFRNASGVLRNVSSAGEYARRKLREIDGLVDSLLFLVRAAIGKNDMDNKSVENCVCILRNLSYRCQEVVDPEYDKHPPGVTGPSSTNLASGPTTGTSHTVQAHHHNLSSGSGQSPSSTLSPSSSSSSKNSTSSLMGGLSSKVGDNLSCFGGSKKKSKQPASSDHHHRSTMSPSASVNALEGKTAQLSLNGQARSTTEGAPKGMELLWQTEVVQPYLSLLSECSNPETLEAAAGAIQNLAACYWQPSIDIRGAVRKEKGLPVLVELLRMEVDRVVCAVATALRNLAMDTRNKELIGKYALKDLVSKLPMPGSTGLPLETGTSDDTVAAVLATLNEVIARNADFAKSLLEAGGMQRLTLITKHRNRFSTRVVKFTSQLLYNMWQHTELRETYKKAGFKESHFIVQLTSNPPRAGNASMRNGTLPITPSGSTFGLVAPGSGTSGNGSVPSGAMYHSISANNTLSRPMSTVGGTKYEDHHTMHTVRTGTLPRPNNQAANQAMLQARMQDELVMSEMTHAQQQHLLQAQLEQISNGTGTLMRPPIGGVSIFPPGVVPGEPVYAQVNRERKRQQQQQQAQLQAQMAVAGQHSPSGTTSNTQQLSSAGSCAPLLHHPQGIGAPPPPKPNDHNNHSVLLDPTNNEPIYPPSMPAGDSWV